MPPYSLSEYLAECVAAEAVFWDVASCKKIRERVEKDETYAEVRRSTCRHPLSRR